MESRIFYQKIGLVSSQLQCCENGGKAGNQGMKFLMKGTQDTKQSKGNAWTWIGGWFGITEMKVVIEDTKG